MSLLDLHVKEKASIQSIKESLKRLSLILKSQSSVRASLITIIGTTWTSLFDVLSLKEQLFKLNRECFTFKSRFHGWNGNCKALEKSIALFLLIKSQNQFNTPPVSNLPMNGTLAVCLLPTETVEWTRKEQTGSTCTYYNYVFQSSPSSPEYSH